MNYEFFDETGYNWRITDEQKGGSKIRAMNLPRDLQLFLEKKKILEFKQDETSKKKVVVELVELISEAMEMVGFYMSQEEFDNWMVDNQSFMLENENP